LTFKAESFSIDARKNFRRHDLMGHGKVVNVSNVLSVIKDGDVVAILGFNLSNGTRVFDLGTF